MREDVRAAQATAAMLLLFGVLLPILAGFLWLAAPGGFRPMIYEPPWYETALPWVGAGGYLFGLGWMILRLTVLGAHIWQETRALLAGRVHPASTQPRPSPACRARAAARHPSPDRRRWPRSPGW